MAELPNIIAKALAQSGCNIESITMSCLINNNTGTTSFSMNESYTIFSLAAYFTIIPIAVNHHLFLEDNPLTVFQLPYSIVDIGLNMF